MWSLIKSVLLKIAAVRFVLKLFGGILLLPLAFLFKAIGVPILVILSIFAMPVLFFLFILGMPVFLVLIVGVILMMLLGFALKIGVVALKVGLFIVLPLWAAWTVATWMRDRIWRREPPTTPSTGDATA